MTAVAPRHEVSHQPSARGTTGRPGAPRSTAGGAARRPRPAGVTRRELVTVLDARPTAAFDASLDVYIRMRAMMDSSEPVALVAGTDTVAVCVVPLAATEVAGGNLNP
jgi:hypothetical protein